MAFNLYSFTPPTCTLLITAKTSPLARWTTKNITKKLRFQLKFDDPGAPNIEPITVHGSEQELVLLQSSISHYIQRYLSSTPKFSQLNSDFSPTIENYEQNTEQQLRKRPYLKSVGLLHHELFLGPLNHDCAGDHIRLSTVQLFDLVSALEDYQAKITQLPIQSKKNLASLVPPWGAVAALLIGVVGIAAVISRSQLSGNIATRPQSTPKVTKDLPELAEITPPPEPRQSNSFSKAKSDSLATLDKLPPPPAVDAPKPKPDIPDPADYELSQVARQSGLKIRPDNAPPSISTQAGSHQEKSSADSASQSSSPETSETDSTNPSAELKIPVAIESEIKSFESASEPSPNIAQRAEADLKTQANLAPNQIALIKNYFQDKWRPPQELKQSLEYRLFLQQNGSIKKIIPLGKASSLYLNQTGLPLNEEAFIPPLAPTDSTTIRLLLNPDGHVQVFAE